MIALEKVSKSFGDVCAVDGVSFDAPDGAFCVLLGPSGCGKSTVLRMINAMIAPDAGRVLARGRDVASLDAIELRRSIGYCVQSVGLFPHWNVERNIAAVPTLLGWSEARTRARVAQLCESLGVDPALLRRRPRELSGGQAQRVGLARALAADPDILLMDEPFAALDPKSRAALQDEMLALRARGGRTVIFVTHDVEEALRLASMIVVMQAGRVVQAASPQEILLRPADPFVADFLGSAQAPLRRLEFTRVAERMRAYAGAPGEGVGAQASLREALTLMLARGASALPVNGTDGAPVGEIAFADILARREP